MSHRLCRVDGCVSQVYKNDMCKRHLRMFQPEAFVTKPANVEDVPAEVTTEAVQPLPETPPILTSNELYIINLLSVARAKMEADIEARLLKISIALNDIPEPYDKLQYVYREVG